VVEGQRTARYAAVDDEVAKAWSVGVTPALYTARMNSSAPLRMVVLGSGSSGNATVVTDGQTTLLIDCGFSALEVSKRLAAAGIAAASVDGMLVTHEHGDHVRGIDVFCRRHAPECLVLATEGTVAKAGLSHTNHQTVKGGSAYRIGTLTVVPFCTSHDAVEPVGYRIEGPLGSAGIATDTGVLTPQALEGMAGCQLIALESNHDERMLDSGPYPWHLKRRIRSAHGHLSNNAAADAIEALAHDGLQRVIAMHRSRTNNTKEMVAAVLEHRIGELGLKVPVTVAAQDLSCDSDPPQQSLFRLGA